MVDTREILDALGDLVDALETETGNEFPYFWDLIKRIQSESIAPPEGMVLVPIAPLELLIDGALDLAIDTAALEVNGR